MKKVMMALPVVAIMFAVAGAFATNFSPAVVTPTPVTSITVDPCTRIGFCDTTVPNVLCATNSGVSTVYERISSTSCATPLVNGKFE
jgi:hypothetical protein